MSSTLLMVCGGSEVNAKLFPLTPLNEQSRAAVNNGVVNNINNQLDATIKGSLTLWPWKWTFK